MIWQYSGWFNLQPWWNSWKPGERLMELGFVTIVPSQAKSIILALYSWLICLQSFRHLNTKHIHIWCLILMPRFKHRVMFFHIIDRFFKTSFWLYHLLSCHQSLSHPFTVQHKLCGFFKFCMYLYFMYMSVCLCACMYHVHAWCLKRSEVGIRSPETGVMDVCELPHVSSGS